MDDPGNPLLAAARRYLKRGWTPVYVEPGVKGPTDKGWQNQRFTEADLPVHFDRPGNIGIILGEASGGLVDVDLDCPEALELADQLLPPTDAVTGRPGAPRSHRWYVADVPGTKQFRDPQTRKMIVELRSTGGQTLVGPKLTEAYLSRRWRRDDGAELRIERCLIDANWGQSTDVVYQFCRQSGHAAVLLPSHGRYVGASSVPFSEYKKKRGDRVGHHWRIPNVRGRRQVRHVVIDTNYWKSFIHSRLAVAMGDPGGLSIFGRRPNDHQLLADHVTAEYRVRTEARGRVVDEWKLRIGNSDNHWFDCLVGCAVAASIQGAVLPGTGGVTRGQRQRVRLSDLQRTRP